MGLSRLGRKNAETLSSVAGGMLPQGAAVAIALAECTSEALVIMIEKATFHWHEILDVSPRADAGTPRKAMTTQALIYHPNTGGSPEQMIRVNAAYEAAQARLEGSESLAT